MGPILCVMATETAVLTQLCGDSLLAEVVDTDPHWVSWWSLGSVVLVTELCREFHLSCRCSAPLMPSVYTENRSSQLRKARVGFSKPL